MKRQSKGQFMVLTAMIVSVIVIGTVATISEIQSKTYTPDDQGYYINRMHDEAQKVTAQDEKEIENFKRMVNTLNNYNGDAEYWSRSGQRDCFNITLTKPGTELQMTCVEVGDPVTELEVMIYSIGYDARQSEGGNAPLPPSGSTSDYGGVYRAEDNFQLLDGQRSYGVSVFNEENGEWMFHESYDVYGDSNEADRMADDLNNLPNNNDVIVFVTTQDEPQTNRLSNGLESAMYNIGASSSVFGASDFKYRSAYLMVGSPGLGEGNAYIEEYAGSVDRDADAWVRDTYTLSFEP